MLCLKGTLPAVLLSSTLLLSCSQGTRHAEQIPSAPRPPLSDTGPRSPHSNAAPRPADLQHQLKSTRPATDAAVNRDQPHISSRLQRGDLQRTRGGSSTRRKGSKADTRALSRALSSLGIPGGTTRALLGRIKRPRPDCTYRHDPSQSTTRIFSFSYPRGAAKETFAVVEQLDAAPVLSVAIATPHFGAFMKRLFRAGFEPDRGSGYPPKDVAVYQRKGVRVSHYKFWPMVDDVVSALSRCTGKDKASIQQRLSIFVIHVRAGGSPR